MSETQRVFDFKTKPRGSLGVLEALAVRIGALQGVAVPPKPAAAIVVAAADHGVAAEGVSAYPQEVTVQMVANFVAGGAAINVLARRAGAQLLIEDRGVGVGTRNMVEGSAMTPEQVERELTAAAALVDELEVDVIGLGEMGIANTTSASALTAALLDVDPALVCGPGTGITDVAHKVDVVRRALAVNAGADPLTALGGFEIAFLAGVVLACERKRIAVLLDGFITGAAALAAVRISPSAVDVLTASHRSPEPGHALVLDALGLDPLLDLGLRLGEGSGAALALPLLQASVAIIAEMATFGDAGVTDAGR